MDRDRLVTALYVEIDAYQRTARTPGLQHAQIRLDLAERLADGLLPTFAAAPPVPAVSDAERRDRYAAAMARRDGHTEWPPQFEDDERDYRRRADAAIAVADAEQVDLRAQLARVRAVADAIDTEMRTEPDTLRAAMQQEAVVRIRAALDGHPLHGEQPAAAPSAPASPAPLAARLPLVQGRCPACGTAGLFLGDGGYVTCSVRECPEPDAASTTLERQAAVQPLADAARGLTVQQADALWDAIAIPGGPHVPTFPEQHERVCRAVAGILAEVTAVPEAVPADGDLRDRIRRAICEADGFAWDPDGLEPDEYGGHADAVLAVLPAPADRTDVGTEFVRQVDHLDEAGLAAVETDLADRDLRDRIRRLHDPVGGMTEQRPVCRTCSDENGEALDAPCPTLQAVDADEAQQPAAEHVYLSTGCLHGDTALPDGRTGHEYCQTDARRYDGTHKTAATCKFCSSPCVCPCHTSQAQPAAEAEHTPEPT